MQYDSISFLLANAQQFTHIHASPPCQRYSSATNGSNKERTEYSDDAQTIGKLLYGLPITSVIENVPAAPIRGDLILSGEMFGLRVRRERKFECVNWFCMRPSVTKLRKGVHYGHLITVAGNGQLVSPSGSTSTVPGDTVVQKWSYAMGIDWMTRSELAQAIPPAYTEYIGLQWFKNYHI